MKRKVGLATTVRATAPEVVDFLWEHPSSVLGDCGPAQAGDARRFRSELHVDGHHGSVRHDILSHLTVGPDLGTWRLTIEPLGGRRVLPSFEGWIVIEAAADGAELRLVGTYEVPLGAAGAFGDAVLGHRLATQSLQSFLAELGNRLDERIDATIPQGGRPAPAGPDLRRPNQSQKR